jgi:hypothetical protein
LDQEKLREDNLATVAEAVAREEQVKLEQPVLVME